MTRQLHQLHSREPHKNDQGDCWSFLLSPTVMLQILKIWPLLLKRQMALSSRYKESGKPILLHCPLDRDRGLSCGWCYPPIEQLGPEISKVSLLHHSLPLPPYNQPAYPSHTEICSCQITSIIRELKTTVHRILTLVTLCKYYILQLILALKLIFQKLCLLGRYGDPVHECGDLP